MTTRPPVAPRRQYHLRCLLIMTSMLVVGCGWSGPSESDYAKNERIKGEASEEIRKLGGKCTARQYPQGEGWVVDLKGVTLNEQTFELLKTLGRVTELNLSQTNVSDGDCEKLNQIEIGSVILKLDISDTAVTDAGLSKLTAVNFISEVNAGNSKVTAEGAKKFTQSKPRKPKVILTSK